MLIRRAFVLFFLLTIAAIPCVQSFPRQIWAKRPGSESRFFAFEAQGKVAALIDQAGKVISRFPGMRIIDTTGDLIIIEAEGKKGIRSFQPGKFVYRDFPGLQGFMDDKGTVIIPPTLFHPPSRKLVRLWQGSHAPRWMVTVTGS